MSKRNNIKHLASVVRCHGEEGDTVLAHISPAEARFMAKKYGCNENPHTGLPQYGLFKKIAKFVSPITSKSFRKNALPIVGAVVGNTLAPGVGGTIGGTIGGAVGGGKKGAIKGGIMGSALGAFGPSVGNSLGVSSQGFAGKALGMGSPGLLGQLGIAGAKGAAGASAGKSGVSGLLGKVTSSLGGGLNTALLGTAALGMLKGKSKYPKYEGPSAGEMMSQHGMVKPVGVTHKPRSAKKPRSRAASNYGANPYARERTWINQDEPEFYAAGGHVYASGGNHHGKLDEHGVLRSKTGGQTDDIEVSMLPHSYVQDATTVSLYGDGDTEAGFERLKELKDKFVKAALAHGYKPPKGQAMMPAKVSGGEMIWEPAAVYGAGLLVKGDPEMGVQVLDTFRDNLREQKGVKKFLPPKSKDASYYLEG